jgi:hypothetical protein
MITHEYTPTDTQLYLDTASEATLTPELVLTDAEVAARFDALVDELDASITLEDEAKLGNIIVAKVNGTEEEFGMWAEYTQPTPPAAA